MDVLTVHDDGRASETDERILGRCTELDRVLFTQDRDFLRKAALRQQAGIEFAGIFYFHQFGASISQCIRDLEPIAGAGDVDRMRSRVQYLPIS